MRKRWWRLLWAVGRRPVRGCRVLVFDAEERVLLIRHSYGEGGWMLPGGGIGRGEDAVAAGAREVLEETACRLAGVVELGQSADSSMAIRHEVHLVAGWTVDTPRPDGREIVAAAFFAPEALPEDLSPRLAEALAGYLTRAKAARPAPPR